MSVDSFHVLLACSLAILLIGASMMFLYGLCIVRNVQSILPLRPEFFLWWRNWLQQNVGLTSMQSVMTLNVNSKLRWYGLLVGSVLLIPPLSLTAGYYRAKTDPMHWSSCVVLFGNQGLGITSLSWLVSALHEKANMEFMITQRKRTLISPPNVSTSHVQPSHTVREHSWTIWCSAVRQFNQ